MPTESRKFRRRCANALRFLAIDAVQAANSGHPGMPMGMADIAEVLWRHHLKHNPANPRWHDRDRFVLSNGHGSMLIYALLHLSGYGLSIDELKCFRQLHSKTPGHPEFGITPGIETTTGPLGQGLANAVGMALAERLLAETFNRDGHRIVDHYTYAFIGDGCLMEGISHEACSLAGRLSLSKLIVFYDDNDISIDGHVQPWFADDTAKRFEAYGWRVVSHCDGHDADSIEAAIRIARTATGRPTLICCKTMIGFGSPNKGGTHDVHGAPLGAEEIANTRRQLEWPFAAFEVPADVRAGWNARGRGEAAEYAWKADFSAYRAAFPALAAEFERRMGGELPAEWPDHVAALLAQWTSQTTAVATRKASQNAIEAIAPLLPELLGGSADLTGSNLTNWSGTRPANREAGGNYINYGVREFGMTAIANGIALHGGFIPYTATFLVFSDYARNAIRLAALMKLRQLMVYTHDSIGLGEDGPTHQPIEHAASLRLIPGLDVWRPADAMETAVAWTSALERDDGPSCFLLSRQNLPALPRSAEQIASIRLGGYVLREAESGTPSVVLIGTGSELGLTLNAQAILAREGIAARVVSMPCTQRFDRQPLAYRRGVLPPSLPMLAVEAGHPDLWWKYVGLNGAVIGIDRFGESAPAAELYEYFAINVANIVAQARCLIAPEP
ncbi:MAG: transketolase [Candidatus Accumulibacter phosphatis]|uniref:Transketolase n=2 Tax=Candidatus Accumulibacter TaxID=327159 RepID=A0A7D5SD79_9PROT|nr:MULTISPECIES: transketolase [Candidatus Accumulibacter]QLH49518.1 MAG: transketolase [Candidatus Accumulibacter cognatus]MBN8516915.1 transketolase [Accumulibacter sp.]MBO3712331.1 transketolase [Accumulibacter sp.]MCC2867504.1 transketolase [Candidatus Accumulibacter phosphatis]MCM8580334.1 transketolase [Accumulibacter sp.]